MQVPARFGFRFTRRHLRARNAVLAILALVATQLTFTTFGMTSPAQAATPGVNSNFDCYGDTIYSTQSFGDGTSGIYALDTSTLANPQVSTTHITDIPNESDPNALAITNGGGEAITVKRLPGASTVNIYKYDADTSVWTVDPNGTADPAANFVAGAYDPFNQVYYYVDYENPVSTVYGYDVANNQPISGVIATIDMPFPNDADNNGMNGDITFDRDGNLYLVQSQDTDVAVATVSGPLPTVGETDGSAPELASNTLATYTKPELVRYKGMTLDNSGHMYILYGDDSASTYLEELNPTTGAVISSPSEIGSNGSLGTGTDLGACSANPTLRAAANVTGRGRSSDQFSLSITGSGVTGNNTATTTGSGTGVQGEVAGPVTAVSDTTYTVTQTAASGNLSYYNVSYDCTDAAAGDRSVASGAGSSITLDFPAPAANATGADVTCTFTDTPKPASLDTVLSIQSVNGSAPTNAPLAPGDSIVYQVVTTNTGGVDASTTWTDNVPSNTHYAGSTEGWACTPDNTAGSSCTEDVSVDRDSSVSDTYTVVVDSSVPAVRDRVSTSTGTCSACNVLYPNVDILDTVKTIASINGDTSATSSTAVKAGDVVVYRDTVTNTGGISGTTTLTDTVPTHSTYTGTSQGWNCPTNLAGSACTQDVTVAAGNSASVDYTVTVAPLPAGARQVQSVVESSNGTCSACTQTNATVAQLNTTETIYRINGSAPTTNVQAGDTITYLVHTVNDGGSPGSTTVTETVPNDATYTGVNEGWTNTCSTAGTTCSVTISSLAPGDTDDYYFTVQVDASLPPGNLTISDTSSSAPGNCPNCTVNVDVAPTLDTVAVISKVNNIAATSATHIAADDVVVYRVTVHNTGGSDGTTTVSNPVPANSTYSGTAEGWSCTAGDPAATPCTQNVTVHAGQQQVLTFTVHVDSPLPIHTANIVDQAASTSGSCTCTVTNATAAVLDTTLTILTAHGVTADSATQLAAGDTVTYQATITNTGGSAAIPLLTDIVPPHTRYTGSSEGWSCPQRSATSNCTQGVPVSANSAVSVTFTVQVDQPLAADTTVIDDAVSSNLGTCTACSVSNATVAVLDTVKHVTAVKGNPASDTTPLRAQDVVEYTITVTNTGGTAASTTLTETVPANTTYTGDSSEGWNCADTAAGSHCTQTVNVAMAWHESVPFTVTVGAVPSGVTDIENVVSSSAGTCGGCDVVTPTFAALDTVKTIDFVNGAHASNATALAAGDVVQYTVTVTNNGGATGTTMLTETIPTNSRYTGPSTEGWTCASGVCSQAVTAVPFDPPVSRTFTVTLDSPLPFGTQAIVSTVHTSVGTCSVCTVSNPTVGVLQTYKYLTTVNGNAAAPGVRVKGRDVLGYRILVMNGGGSPAATTLTEAVPAHSLYVGKQQGWSCVAPADAGTPCIQSVSVPGGGTDVRGFTIEVKYDLLPADRTINAAVTTSNGTCPVCRVATPLQQSDLVVTKTADRTKVNVGDTVNFIIKVHNNGPDVASGVVLHDVFSGMKYKSGTVSQGNWNAATGHWVVGSLASGATAVMHTSYVVTHRNGKNVAAAFPPVQVDPDPSNNVSGVKITDPTAGGTAGVTNGVAPLTPGGVTLASTGVPTWTLLRIAGALLAVGLGLCFGARRRRTRGANA